MSKLSLKDILNIQPLSFYIEAQEFGNFVTKRSDYEILANLYNSEKIDKIFSNVSKTNEDATGEGLFEERDFKKDSDCMVTSLYGKALEDVLLANEKKVDTEKLLLFLAGLAVFYVTKIENGKKEEIVYRNGDIVIADKGKLVGKSKDSDEYKPIDDLLFKQSLVEGIFIAYRMLQEQIKKNKNINVSGVYVGRGTNAKDSRFTFDLNFFEKVCDEKQLYLFFSNQKIEELLQKRILSKQQVLKHVSKEMNLILFKEGIFEKSELLNKVFKAKNFDEVLKRKNESIQTKLLIYLIGETDIETLRKSFSNREESFLKIFYNSIANMVDTKKQLGEILTHDIFTYSEAMEFLDALLEKGVIDQEQKEYYKKIREDFDTNEIISDAVTGKIDFKRKPTDEVYKKSTLSIDPDLRFDYFESIGTVKRILINGEFAVSEADEDLRKRSNSLDGYELLVIPEKRIAV